MDLTTELLVPSHVADLRHAARARRLAASVYRWRRLVLGFLPLTEPCEPCGRR
jgi:hypothetical protein